MRFGCLSFCRDLGRVFFALPLAQILSAASSELAENWKAKTDQWIELEQRIATEQNEWRADKEVMESSRTVLQREQAALKARLEANELAQSLFRQRLDTLQQQLETQRAGRALLVRGLEREEARIRTWHDRLPAPLRERLAPLLLRLGPGPADQPVSVSERVQTVISVLTAIDQFNGTVTLTHHLRTDEAGVERDVEVLYWGLAMAYAVDQTGSKGWLILPSSEGWTWQEAPEAAARIRELIEIHKRKRSPGLVSLPAALQEGAK